jgi:hypothetical protein
MCKKVLFLLAVLGFVASVSHAAPLLLEDGEGPMDGGSLPYTLGANETNSATDDYWKDLTYQPGGRWKLNTVSVGQDTTDKVSGTGSLKLRGSVDGVTGLSSYMYGGGPSGSGTDMTAYLKGMDYYVKLNGPDSDTIVLSEWTDEAGGADLYSWKALLFYWSEAGTIGQTDASWNSGTARRQAGVQLYGGCSRDISNSGGDTTWAWIPSLISLSEWHHVNIVTGDSFGRPIQFTDDNSDGLPDVTNPSCKFSLIDGYVVNIRNSVNQAPMTPAQCIAAPSYMRYVEEADLRTKGTGYDDYMWTAGMSKMDCFGFRADQDIPAGYDWDMWIDDAYLVPEPASLVLLGLGGLLLRKRR